MVFASDAEGQFDIYIVPSDGGKPRNITSHPAMEHVPNFSSDGKWIYFSSNRSGRHQVWKVPVEGGGPAGEVLQGVLNGAFQVVERGIYYIDQASAKSTLRFFDFAGRRSVAIAGDLGQADEIGGFAASRDGRTVLYVKRDSSVDDLMPVEHFK